MRLGNALTVFTYCIHQMAPHRSSVRSLKARRCTTLHPAATRYARKLGRTDRRFVFGLFDDLQVKFTAGAVYATPLTLLWRPHPAAAAFNGPHFWKNFRIVTITTNHIHDPCTMLNDQALI